MNAPVVMLCLLATGPEQDMVPREHDHVVVEVPTEDRPLWQEIVVTVAGAATLGGLALVGTIYVKSGQRARLEKTKNR